MSKAMCAQLLISPTAVGYETFPVACSALPGPAPSHVRGAVQAVSAWQLHTGTQQILPTLSAPLTPAHGHSDPGCVTICLSSKAQTKTGSMLIPYVASEGCGFGDQAQPASKTFCETGDAQNPHYPHASGDIES